MHSAYTVTLCLLAGATNAHMLLNTPRIFPSLNAVDDNGPIPMSGGGAKDYVYPCKMYQSPEQFYHFDFPRTELPIGTNFSMSLTGSAVHGGGSCQISLTKDLAPSASSTFKVIHSVQGGCPARNEPGNRPSNATADDPDQYEFPIPNGLEPGDYTFAWTWFNAVGNREMYMNCAPVTVTGGGSKAKRDSSFFDSLPDIYLANIPGVHCRSSSGGTATIKFPNPGDSVELNPITPPNSVTDNTLQHVLLDPVGTDCHAPLGAGSGGSASVQAGGSYSAPPSSASASVSPSYTPAAGGDLIYQNAAPPINSASDAASSIVAQPATSSGAMASASALPDSGSVSTGSSSGSGSGSCPSTAVPCSTPGSVVCVGSNQFGLCDINNCALVQAVAAGTTCANGVISKRSDVVMPAMSHRRRGMHPHGSPHRYIPHY